MKRELKEEYQEDLRAGGLTMNLMKRELKGTGKRTSRTRSYAANLMKRELKVLELLTNA